MRFSQALISTLKEPPREAEAISHNLMLRAGMIRKLASGFYCYLPLGWKVLLKIINVIRREMNAAGAQEVLLPAIHPAELWEKTARLSILGEDMIKIRNRNGKLLVLAPTHEEVITWLVANEVHSYRQLPLILYQIQTKFRDEPRPRFGVIRTCEFIMKDGYSFDVSWESLEQSYKKMYDTYSRIFEEVGLNYFIVEADPGVMGGDVSHEFMAPSEFGEDKVVICSKCNYSASLEVAARKEKIDEWKEEKKEAKEVHTPGISSVEEVSKFLNLEPRRLLKTIIYFTGSDFIGVLVRGDHEISEFKLRNYLKIKRLRMATPEEINSLTNAEVGFSGPIGLSLRLIADYDIKGMKNCVTGANKTDYHIINVNLGRDFKVEEFADIRYARENDTCPRCSGKLEIKTAIEIGHIFKLGTRYSEPLNATFLNPAGESRQIIMGCYGIGVNRIMAAFIEQNYDQRGIIWNRNLAPYEIILILTNPEDERLLKKADEIYHCLQENHIEVLYDDREVRAGIKFNDADLLGIPYQIVLGDKYLREKKFDFRSRDRKTVLELDKIDTLLKYL